MNEIINDIGEFYNILCTTGNFYNKTFNLENCDLEFSGEFKVDGGTILSENSNFDALRIQNCTFNCKKIEFLNINNEKLHIDFESCTFNCGIILNNCNIERLWLSNTKALEYIEIGDRIAKDKFIANQIRIVNDENLPRIKSIFFLKNLEIEDFFAIENIDIEEISIYNSVIKDFSIYNSTLSYLYFNKNSFSGNARFNKIKLQKNNSDVEKQYNECVFAKNKFENVTFLETDFEEKRTFQNCEFQNITRFEKCKNIENSELKFIDCDFKGFTSFKYSEFNSLDIDNCIFDKATSFIETTFNKLRLSEVNFIGKTYFDDIKINNVVNKSYLKDNVTEWKRTLRTIKQEFQKTENKIDFNRYRNYELNAHYQELSYRQNKTDTTILWATKWSSNFGDWIWSLMFTLIFGFLFYGILYRIENDGVYNPENWNEFFVGAFRFFLITDFHNPLRDRAYLTSVYSWLPFIIGKIFIAFGIYEMIQSFRKFKA